MEYRDSSFRSLQPHQQLTLAVGITPHRAFSQPPFNQPQVFPAQSNRQQKHAPNPCAYCIDRQLFSSCPFLSSTFALLAVGSRRSIQPVSIAFRLAFIPLATHTQGSQLSYLLKSLLMRLF